LSNVTLSLRFLKSRGVDLTNIGASDVVCGNPRLVLGLVWRVMLYSFAQDLGDKDYQVSQHGLLFFVYFEIRSHSLSRGSVQGVCFNSFFCSFSLTQDANAVKLKSVAWLKLRIKHCAPGLQITVLLRQQASN
jgi:hypothetical protein